MVPTVSQPQLSERILYYAAEGSSAFNIALDKIYFQETHFEHI